MATKGVKRVKEFISLSELIAKELPPIRWLIDGLVPEESMVVLAGMSGSYKTWLVMAMTIAVATGRDFLDMFSTQQTGVLIIDEESGERLYSERFKLLTDQEDLPIYLLSMSGYTVNNESVKGTIIACREKGIGLVVVDSMTRVHVGDENASKDVAKFFALLREFTKAGITVLVIHHNRKPGQGGYDASSDMRGSSDIRAAVDIQLAIRRIGESSSIEVRQPKSRYGKEGEPFKLDFREDGESGKLKFVYCGEIKGKGGHGDKEISGDMVREAVMNTVEASPNMNKGSVASTVAGAVGVGLTRVKAEIANMVESGVLVATTGPHNAALLNIGGDKEQERS